MSQRHCTFRGGQFVEDVILQLLHLDLEAILLLNELLSKIRQIWPLFSHHQIKQLSLRQLHITGLDRISALLSFTFAVYVAHTRSIHRSWPVVLMKPSMHFTPFD